MMLPIVINNLQKRKNVTILKRAYADLHEYVQMFNVDNDCAMNFANCAPNEGQFVYMFVKYLEEKQKFRNFKRINESSSLCIKRDPNTTAWYSIAIYPSPIVNSNSSPYQFFLLSPTGQYGYVITLHMYDNWYSLKGDIYRSRIFIVTDLKSAERSYGPCAAMGNNKYLQDGKNVFEAYIMNSNRIIPNGSSLCPEGQYYCKPLADTDCTKESGNFTNCLQKIIEDGWEIKYDY